MRWWMNISLRCSISSLIGRIPISQLSKAFGVVFAVISNVLNIMLWRGMADYFSQVFKIREEPESNQHSWSYYPRSDMNCRECSSPLSCLSCAQAENTLVFLWLDKQKKIHLLRYLIINFSLKVKFDHARYRVLFVFYEFDWIFESHLVMQCSFRNPYKKKTGSFLDCLTLTHPIS